MRLSIVNLPINMTKDLILVEFHVNSSCISLEYDGDGDAVVLAMVPRSQTHGSVNLKVHLLSLRQTLIYAQPFTYLAPPQPSVMRVTPTFAPASAASRVRVALENFPSVTALSDLQIQFQSGGVVASARALAFSGGDLEKQAIENLQVDLETPVTLPIGLASLSVLHVRQQVKVAVSNLFTLVDSSSPTTARITGPEGTVEDRVRIPMSIPSEITAHFDNVPSKLDVDPSMYIAQVGQTELPILSAQVAEDRVARIMMSTFPRSKSGPVHAIISFGGEGCSSDCCQNMTCSVRCPGAKTACFSLVYFDDKLPSLTLKSDVAGPAIGGDILKLEIHNFPALESDKDVSFKYELQGTRVFQDIMVVFSNADSTSLLAITPNFRQQCDAVSGSQQIQILIEPKDDPRKAVSFVYTILEVRTELSYVSATLGSNMGSVAVLAEVAYFPYAIAPLVMFGDIELPSKNVEVLSMSTTAATFIKFITPATVPGIYDISILPKICGMPCTDAVHFSFEQYDASLPELVSPVPTSVSFQLKTLPQILVRNAPSFADTASVEVEFRGANGYVHSSFIMNETDATYPTRSLTIITPPEIAAEGHFTIHIFFNLMNGLVKQVPSVPFTFYDGYKIRTIEMSPDVVPTSVVVDGRKLQLRKTVRVLLSNVPQDTVMSELSVVLSSSGLTCPVSSLRHMVTCAWLIPDCNRTMVQIESPSPETPGAEEVVISRIVPGHGSVTLATTKLNFVQPCHGDYDSYCQRMNLITNFQLLAERPTTECSSDYCLDPALIGQPSVLRVSPKEGSKAGGTLVTVTVKDLPAFSASDISVRVKSSTSQEIIPVVELEATSGSSLVASECILTIITEAFPSEDEFGQVVISTMVAGKRISTSFPFEFLPVIVGAAQVQPGTVQIFEGQALQVKVVLTNVPKLQEPFEPSNIIVSVNGTEVVNGVEILSSDRHGTILQLTISDTEIAQSTLGTVRCAIGARSQGSDGLGYMLIEKIMTPAPTVLSIYPPLDTLVPSDTEHFISAKVAYLKQSGPEDFFVQMGTSSGQSYSVAVEDVIGMMASDCVLAHCSMLELKMKIPALTQDDQRAPTIGTVSILSTSRNVTRFEIKYMAVGQPSVKAIEPASLQVLGSGVGSTQLVTLYIENYPDANCKYASVRSCAQQALEQGISIHSVPFVQGSVSEGSMGTREAREFGSAGTISRISRDVSWLRYRNGHLIARSSEDIRVASSGFSSARQNVSNLTFPHVEKFDNLSNVSFVEETPAPLHLPAQTPAPTSYPKVVEAVDRGGMLAVTIEVLSSMKACDKNFRVELASGMPSRSVDFALKYKMPEATVFPMDGSKAGSDVITVSARGWYDDSELVPALPSATNGTLQLYTGEAQIDPSQILSVSVDKAVLRIQLVTPPSPTADIVACSIVGIVGGIKRTSSFYFEYFDPPKVLSLEPERATLFGRTTAEDSRSVLLSASGDFPHVTSAEEIIVTVGEKTSQVTSVTTSTDGYTRFLYVRIRVPEMNVPGDAIVTIEPRMSDANRQAQRLSTVIKYFQPLPVLATVMWCESCPDSGVCIVMGRCVDNSEPLRNLLPKTGL